MQSRYPVNLLTLCTCLEQHSRLQYHSRADACKTRRFSTELLAALSSACDTKFFPVKAQTLIEMLYMWLQKKQEGLLVLITFVLHFQPILNGHMVPKRESMVHMQDTSTEGNMTAALAQKS